MEDLSRLLSLSGRLEERCPDFCRLHKWLPVNWDNMEESIAVYQHKKWVCYVERVIMVIDIPITL